MTCVRDYLLILFIKLCNLLIAVVQYLNTVLLPVYFILKIIGSFSGHLVWVVIISFLTITIIFSPIMTFSQFVDTQQEKNNSSINKVVILTFGNGVKSQFTEAKPILDKYGFKASFFVV